MSDINETHGGTGSTPPPYSTPGAAPYAAEPAAGASSEDRTLALLTHLSGIILGFVVPLIMWLVNKDRADKAFVVDQAKEALNFNITLLIVYVGLFFASFLTFGLAGLVSPLVWLVSVVLFIVAGVKANGGEAYRYPVALRLVK